MRFYFLFLLLPVFSLSQTTIHLTQLTPDPFAVKKSSFHNTTRSPLPFHEKALKVGKNLLLHHYLQQRYLVTDSSKVKPIWFSLVMGFDGSNFWVAVDTDYDGNFENEKPEIVSLPDGLFFAETFQSIETKIFRFDLDSFPLTGTKWHPAFPVFLEPEFSFYTEERDISDLVMNTVLVSGHKAITEITLKEKEYNLAIQLFPLMSDFSLFEFYNPKHQQMSWFNLLEKNGDDSGQLVSFTNAYSFVVKKEIMAIEPIMTYLLPEEIDFPHKTITLFSQPMVQTAMEERIDECEVTSARYLTSTESFKLPTQDSIILYFTGSWCAPCREITPKVEALFKKLPEGWKGIVVANEKELIDAKKYLNNYHFENMLYEPLTDKSACSLKKIFAIGLYPSFIYLSPSGKLLGSGITQEEGKIFFNLPSLR